MTDANPSISEILKNVDKQLDKDTAFILAGVTNVYLDAMVRIGGRQIIGPNDIGTLLDLWRTFVAIGDIQPTTIEKDLQEVTGAPRPRVRPTQVTG